MLNAMKTFLLSSLILVSTFLVTARAEDDGSLPFPVSIGGQAATYTKGEPFAKVAKPVKNNAAIEITAKADGMIIINVAKANDKGEPAEGAQPAVILLQNTNKGTLDGTMDKQKLAAGTYLMNVVAEGRTASIVFMVE